MTVMTALRAKGFDQQGLETIADWAAAAAAVNPHNQMFGVAIQLGLIGAVVLVAMWLAHFMLFFGSSLTACAGMIVVVQNIVSSLFNSHLFDFSAARWQACCAAKSRAMMPISLPEKPRILVIALRRLGDVLLTTPLIRSIKRAFPAASIDALVFAGTQGILAGNPDIAGIIAVPPRPSAGDTLDMIRRLARRYDLALSTQSGDRPTTLAWIAGRQSAGPIEDTGFAATIKGWALTRSYVRDHEQHRVRDMLRLAELIGIPAIAEIVCPSGDVRADILPHRPYAVVHAAPMFIYKRWTADGWRELALPWASAVSASSSAALQAMPLS